MLHCTAVLHTCMFTFMSFFKLGFIDERAEVVTVFESVTSVPYWQVFFLF